MPQVITEQHINDEKEEEHSKYHRFQDILQFPLNLVVFVGFDFLLFLILLLRESMNTLFRGTVFQHGIVNIRQLHIIIIYFLNFTIFC